MKKTAPKINTFARTKRPSAVRSSCDDGATLFLEFLKQIPSDRWDNSPPSKFKAGQFILEGTLEVQAGAAVAAAKHFGTIGARVRGKSEHDQWNIHGRPGWHLPAIALQQSLLRRKLPFTEDQICELAEAFAEFPCLTRNGAPQCPSLVRTLERYQAEHDTTPRLSAACNRIAAALDQIGRAEERRLGYRLRQLVADESATPPNDDNPGPMAQTLARIEQRVTRYIAPATPERLDASYVPPTPGLADSWPQFLIDPFDPDAGGIAIINRALRLAPKSCDRPGIEGTLRAQFDAAADELMAWARGADAVVLWASAFSVLMRHPMAGVFDDPAADAQYRARESFATRLNRWLLQTKTFTPKQLGGIAESISRTPETDYVSTPLESMAEAIIRHRNEIQSSDESVRVQILRARARMMHEPHGWQALSRLDAALHLCPAVPLARGDRPTDAVLACLGRSAPASLADWRKLLTHASASAGSSPSRKWLRQSEEALKAVRRNRFAENACAWLPLLGQPPFRYPGGPIEGRNHTVPTPCNADVLKGLAWLCASFDEPKVASALGDLGMASFKMLPGVGPRCAKVGNACIWSLSQMSGMHAAAQLSRLRSLVKFGSARKMLDKALEAVAARAGVTRADLEELAAPDFGLSPTGTRSEAFGEIACELAVTGTTKAELRWSKGGRPLKSIPASIKTDHAADLKRLKADLADLQKLLPAQRDRVERLLASQTSWALPTWRTRYLDHPLLSLMARRLIWHFTDGDNKRLGIFLDGSLVGPDGRPLDGLTDSTIVRLWHPIGFPVDAVAAWRRFLEERRIVQPFKQAHREVYLLTDAELATTTYSNRFAAHIVKYAQLTRLAQSRSWIPGTQVIYDPTYNKNPRLDLPAWGLRAEFWVNGIGDDTTDAGMFVLVQTDQVRFYRAGAPEAEPLPLTEVPALVFTEVMRDVDLFVGVASIGNDPAWQDRGVHAYDDYWATYSFGDLSAAAANRADILARLLPRLAIHDRCALTGRFLSVRGRLRTYKIHLGSANILMEPNDHYLCIVPARAGADTPGKVFLPFEGDSTLAVILSKAFLLAEDEKITDRSIVSQIRAAP